MGYRSAKTVDRIKNVKEIYCFEINYTKEN